MGIDVLMIESLLSAFFPDGYTIECSKSQRKQHYFPNPVNSTFPDFFVVHL